MEASFLISVRPVGEDRIVFHSGYGHSSSVLNWSLGIEYLLSDLYQPGRKTPVTIYAFAKDEKMITGAMIDGSIQLWKSAEPGALESSDWQSFSFIELDDTLYKQQGIL